MGKLYFRYGAMGSSKTANALMVQYNYMEKGQKCILLKPKTDDRDGAKIVKSRMGLSAKELDCVIVDEAQFLTEEQVDILAEVVDRYDLPVICYGLRTDFTSHLFPGSKRLMEIANYIEEVPTVCWCGRRAHFNARVSNGKIVRTGEQVMVGGNESYVSLCRRHFLSGEVDGKRERDVHTSDNGALQS